MCYWLKIRKGRLWCRLSRVCCSGCGRTASGYDHMSEARHFDLSLWGLCPQGQESSELAMRWFLAQWARRLAGKRRQGFFARTGATSSSRSRRWCVLKRRDMSGIEAIGVDEVQYHRHHYLTVVYQLDEGRRRLLGVFNKRNVKSLLRFFWELGAQKSSQILYVCSDLWKPYLKVIKKKAP